MKTTLVTLALLCVVISCIQAVPIPKSGTSGGNDAAINYLNAKKKEKSAELKELLANLKHIQESLDALVPRTTNTNTGPGTQNTGGISGTYDWCVYVPSMTGNACANHIFTMLQGNGWAADGYLFPDL